MCLKHFGADMFEKADHLKRTVYIPHACQQYLMNANWSLRYNYFTFFFSIYFVVDYFITRQVNIGIKIKGLPEAFYINSLKLILMLTLKN